MKKSILCVGVLGLSLAVLGACSSNDGGNKTAEESTTTISSSTTTEIQASTQQTSERDVIEMSFKDKTLTGPGYKLTIDKTQVGKDNSSGEDGLIIWYKLDNQTEANMVPSDMFSMLTFSQQDDTSEYDLTSSVGTFDVSEALYPMYNEDGSPLEDDAAYDEAVTNQNNFLDEVDAKSDAELLPGKSVQCVTGVVLNNTQGEVKIKLGEDFPASENQELIVSLN
ncbi:DUF5067 domain-containing protein [Enterococcus faecium]|uniref:DUF5067 domain-containing protein n=1 Tax=Enterococcus faecium TaxID=1352 RepID=UPI001121A571|nr:DUF5067 domain-containing protein [Enterococcus faecium]TNX49355.1 DUF5067 domain-containing protein [Enterococcus faecium]